MSLLISRRRHVEEQPREGVTLADLVPLALQKSPSQAELETLVAQVRAGEEALRLAAEEIEKVKRERDALKSTVVKLREDMKALRAAQGKSSEG